MGQPCTADLGGHHAEARSTRRARGEISAPFVHPAIGPRAFTSLFESGEYLSRSRIRMCVRLDSVRCWRPPADPHLSHKNGSSQVPLHATHGGKRSRVHHARHRVLHLGRGGPHRASLGTAGTAGGRKSGRGPSAFFLETPFPPQRPATHHFGFTRCAIPRTAPRANLCGNAPGRLAGPDFARSRIGCSWRPAPVRLRQEAAAGLGTRMAGDEDGGIGISRKNADGPLPRFHPSAVPDASTNAWSNPRQPPCPDTLPLHRGSSRPWRA
jgi:hypothetical protein